MEKLLERSRGGCKKSQEQLVKRLGPLIVASIRRYSAREDDYEDLMQDGYLFILESLGKFDPQRGVNFLWYIKKGLKFFYLNKNRGVIINSLDLDFGEGSFVDLLVSPLDTEAEIVKMDENLRLYQAYEALTDKQRQVVDYFYIRGKNMVEISRSLNLPYRTVVNTKVRAIERMRRILKS